MESVATYAVKLQPIFCITDKRAVSVPDENDKLQQKIICATQFPYLCLIYRLCRTRQHLQYIITPRKCQGASAGKTTIPNKTALFGKSPLTLRKISVIIFKKPRQRTQRAAYGGHISGDLSEKIRLSYSRRRTFRVCVCARSKKSGQKVPGY